MNNRWFDFAIGVLAVVVIGTWALLHYTGSKAYVECISKGEHTIAQCVELTQ